MISMYPRGFAVRFLFLFSSRKLSIHLFIIYSFFDHSSFNKDECILNGCLPSPVNYYFLVMEDLDHQRNEIPSAF